MNGRIILVRHGPSSHVHSGALDRAGVESWRVAYDAAGILGDAQPPASLIALAGHANHVIASDMRRAIESAKRIVRDREVLLSPLLRESPLPIPNWPTPLPLGGWGALMYAAWTLRALRGKEAVESELARASQAARWLADMVSDGSTAVVVTHGVFRRLTSNALLQNGWMMSPNGGGYRHWSAWSFSP